MKVKIYYVPIRLLKKYQICLLNFVLKNYFSDKTWKLKPSW